MSVSAVPDLSLEQADELCSLLRLGLHPIYHSDAALWIGFPRAAWLEPLSPGDPMMVLTVLVSQMNEVDLYSFMLEVGRAKLQFCELDSLYGLSPENDEHAVIAGAHVAFFLDQRTGKGLLARFLRKCPDIIGDMRNILSIFFEQNEAWLGVIFRPKGLDGALRESIRKFLSYKELYEYV